MELDFHKEFELILDSSYRVSYPQWHLDYDSSKLAGSCGWEGGSEGLILVQPNMEGYWC